MVVDLRPLGLGDVGVGDEVVASRAVFVIVTGSDGRTEGAGGNASGTS